MRKHDEPPDERRDKLDAATAEQLRALVRTFSEREDLPTDSHEIMGRVLWLQRLVYWARRR